MTRPERRKTDLVQVPMEHGSVLLTTGCDILNNLAKNYLSEKDRP